MTTDNGLVVRDSDQNLFLDRVVNHGTQFGKLNDSRRAALVDDAVHYNMLLCDELGLNRESHDNVLEAAKLIEKMMSVELEIASGGALDIAVEILIQQSVGKIVSRIKNRILAVYKRVFDLRRRGQQHYDYFHSQAGIVSIKLATARPLVEIAEDFHVPIGTVTELWTMADLRDRRVRWMVLNAINTRAKLLSLEEAVKYAEFELAVSQKFLPWAELRKTAKLMVYHELGKDDRRIKEAVLAADEATDDSESAWGVDTMIATIALNIIVSGGSRTSPLHRSVIQWNKFKALAARVFTDEQLKSEMLLAADTYVSTLRPHPTPTEEDALRMLWRGALQEFFSWPIMDATLLHERTAWAPHIHLKTGSRIIYPGEMVWREAPVMAGDDEFDEEFDVKPRKKRKR